MKKPVMNRGFVLFWRKLWDSPDFSNREPFSEREAWIYVFSNLANGIERNGMIRGQFQASENFLAKRWLWSKSKVHRILKKWEELGMIKYCSDGTSEAGLDTKNVNRLPNRLPNQQANRITVCNYDIYNHTGTGYRTGYRTGTRTESKEGIKESLKEGIKEKEKKPPIPPRGNGDELENLFDAFWSWYPRHEAKQAARRAFMKLYPDRALVESWKPWLEKAARSDQWQDIRMIPHAATWLNQARWEGDAPPSKDGRPTMLDLALFPEEDPKQGRNI